MNYVLFGYHDPIDILWMDSDSTDVNISDHKYFYEQSIYLRAA